MRKTIPFLIALFAPGALYANDTRSNIEKDCEAFNKSNKCDVCFDGGEVSLGSELAFAPVLNFSPGSFETAYFDDENKIVYEYKTLTPKITTWSVSDILLEYPPEFEWGLYDGRKVHKFEKGSGNKRILQTKANSGIRLREINDDLTEDYDFRFKFITRYRTVKGPNKFSKKKKRTTCTFYKATRLGSE